MEKTHLAWEIVGEAQEDFQCFASSFDNLLIGDAEGRVHGVGKCNFLLYSEPVLAISHLRTNIFAVLQNFTSIVEISDSFRLIGCIKMKIQGICERFCWTKSTVYTLELQEIYNIEEKDGEITQVSEFPGGFIVSSLVRSVIVTKDKTVQIGKKERNGWFGTCELNGSIFSARPLGNLWEANAEGVVMITTNYKIKSEKASFGILHPVKGCILSLNKENSGFILLDPRRKSVIYDEEYEGTKVYFNCCTSSIYKYYKGRFFLAKIISSLERFMSLMSSSIQEAVVFTLENCEIHKLDLLQGLCEIIFTNQNLIDCDLFEKFASLIESLEKNIPFPRIEIKRDETKRDELFDEFLMMTTQEYHKAEKKVVIKLDKRVKRYYTINFTYQILVNWLLYVILLKNEDLKLTRKFLKIARESLDEVKFYALAAEERNQINIISSIL